MLDIKVNDYIEGYEYYGDAVKQIRGWVDAIGENVEAFHIQADDNWDGYRGTIIFAELGEVIKLESQPRPTMWR